MAVIFKVQFSNTLLHYAQNSSLGTEIAIRQQAITWTIDSHLHHHMASLCHNELHSLSALIKLVLLNSLRPNDAIWRHRSQPTLAQVIAWCLMAASHYLNQCWLPIREVIWHSPEKKAIPQRIISLNIDLLNLLQHLPGANELTDRVKLTLLVKKPQHSHRTM